MAETIPEIIGAGPGHRMTREGPIGELVLTGERRGNPISHELVSGLRRTLRVLPPDVRVLVFRSDDPDFCVGGDVKGFAASNDLPGHVDSLVADFHRLVVDIGALPIPTLCILTGWTAGGGIGLAAACDIIVASDSARFRTGYAKLALTADGGASWHLTRAFGPRRAMEMLTLNEPFDSAEALRGGLVSRVVPDTDLDWESGRLAAELAAAPTASITMLKRLVRDSLSSSLATQLAAEAAAMRAAASGADAAEGVAAFVERRSPVFRGDRQ